MFQTAPTRPSQTPDSRRPGSAAAVRNASPLGALQARLAELGQGSTPVAQLRAMQTLADQQQAPVQRQVLVRDNPVLTPYDHPAAGQAEVQNAASELNQAAAAGAAAAQRAANDYLRGGGKTKGYVRDLTDQGVSPNHAGNFMNRLIEVRMNRKGAKRLAIMAAGYIAEAFANKKADSLGLRKQVVIGNGRPDFALNTGKSWTFRKKEYRADSLFDVTTEAEAAKGHLPAKLVNALVDQMGHYPHLRDISYPGITIGDAEPIPRVLAEDDPRVMARLRIHARRAEMARNRRASLRSATKRKRGKKIRN